MKPLILSIIVFLLLSGCSSSRSGKTVDVSPGSPHTEREFRAAWVATVANIDWPSKPGLSAEDQQKEITAILDTAAALHLNAIVLQVRPHCDAMYSSRIEPWSSYLTGVQGQAPEPFYDPLALWIDGAHKRGIELHAWFNPYRALIPKNGDACGQSIVKRRPDLVKKMKDGMLWLDPSKKEVQDHSFNVVMDVVERYDVDGIHFDDYFYPYGDGTFPDDEEWELYTKSGGTLTREDWRRSAVNTFIERIYKGIKERKRYVKFGLSPFGIWRPGYPSSIAGFDQYNQLYADARLWLNNGWIDYFTPQLYWTINQIPQSFPVLLGWWMNENTLSRNLWPGMIIGRMNNEKGADEIINQIMIERGFAHENPGHVHFSMKTFMRDSSILSAALKNGPYRRPALVPPSLWLDDKAPDAPLINASIADDTLRISWRHRDTADVFQTVAYYKYGKIWEYFILPRMERTISLPSTRIVREISRRRQDVEEPKENVEKLIRVAVTAVDRMGNESQHSFWEKNSR